MRAAAVGRMLSGVDEPVAPRPREVIERTKVRVVTTALASDRAVQGMMEIVAPLRVEAQSAGVPRADEAGVVQIALGDQHVMPPGHRLEGLDLGAQLGEEGLR